MRFGVLLVLFLVVLAGPVFAQKVYIDYDPDYDTDSVKTFAWKQTEQTSLEKADPLLHSRIVNGIEYYLSLGGAQEQEIDPDVYVTCHASSKTEISVDTDHWGYGYPSSWVYGGYYGRYGYPVGGMTTTTVRTYQKGTLVVDVLDARNNQLIWRGTAANITVSADPLKMDKKIDKALKKMVNAWHKAKARRAKG